MPLPSTANMEINLLFEYSSIRKSILKVHSNHPLEGFSWKLFSGKFILVDCIANILSSLGEEREKEAQTSTASPENYPSVWRWFGGLITRNKGTERLRSQPRNLGDVAERCCSRVGTARGWILRQRLFRAMQLEPHGEELIDT